MILQNKETIGFIIESAFMDNSSKNEDETIAHASMLRSHNKTDESRNYRLHLKSV